MGDSRENIPLLLKRGGSVEKFSRSGYKVLTLAKSILEKGKEGGSNYNKREKLKLEIICFSFTNESISTFKSDSLKIRHGF